MNQNVPIHLDKDEAIMKRKVYTKHNLYPFKPIGPLVTMTTITQAEFKNQILEPDIFDLLGQLKHAEYQMFLEFKCKLNEKNNHIEYPIDKSQKGYRKIYAKVKALINAGFIKRVSPGLYVFNPHLIKSREGQDDIKNEWESL